MSGHPLATGCRLMAGVATVTVPDVGSREDYVVVRKPTFRMSHSLGLS
jgi:hypothetical protein